ncbi:MAG: metallophosphoesterase family protein, partial [Chloroflexota bacterium]
DIPTSEFNPYAKVAIEWTAEKLTEANRDYLWGLPLREEQEVFTMVHGSPRNPVWEYLTTEDAAIENLTHFSTRGCLIGHTHVPFLASVENGESVKLTAARPGRAIAISGQRFYLNPGSVGQPRDGDPRASYALLDTEEMTVEFRRVSYDIPAAQRSIRAAGLPDMLAERLSQGR